MAKTLHLLTPDTKFRKVDGPVGVLHEFASDSPWIRALSHEWHTADELMGSPDQALEQVSPLVTKLLRAAPEIEGFSPVEIFEETLLEEFSYIVRACNLDRWISNHGLSTCRFDSYSPWANRLRNVRSVTGSAYQIDAKLRVMESDQRARTLAKLWMTKPGFREFFRRVAPLWSRFLTGPPRRKHSERASRGGTWFLSTAYNYTKIGLTYEPYLGEQMNYLVEDSATGAKRLEELRRDWHLLYAWARRSDVPSPSEVQSIGHRITAELAAIPLQETDNNIRGCFLKGEWWQLFLHRRLPFVLFLSRVLQRWFRAVQPEMIVVGNAGYERALLLHENVRRTPVIMLQHGIMHWVYSVTDQPVDVFVVRGPFFERMLSEKLRRKTVVRNFPEPQHADTPSRDGHRDSILFITTPYDVPAMFHIEDRQDILRAVLRAAEAARRPVIVRVHPLEKVSDYKESIERLKLELGLRVEVSYSQGSEVERALGKSCVAILHFSTMFLDCLRHGIPIVSFAWHWFPNKSHFEKEQIFQFARDLQDLEALIVQGASGRLPIRCSSLEQFLANTTAAEISTLFQEVRRSGKLSCRTVLHPTV
jgi:hypothetical protein